MNPANHNVAATVRARLLNVAKAQGVNGGPHFPATASTLTANLAGTRNST